MDVMDPAELRRRINGSMVARLATVGSDGRPHIVPITFALDDDTIYFAIDFKPKKTAELQRLRNIEANPSVSVLVDHYEDDWSKLWWVRADGSARIHDKVGYVEDCFAGGMAGLFALGGGCGATGCAALAACAAGET